MVNINGIAHVLTSVPENPSALEGPSRLDLDPVPEGGRDRHLRPLRGLALSDHGEGDSLNDTSTQRMNKRSSRGRCQALVCVLPALDHPRFPV